MKGRRVWYVAGLSLLIVLLASLVSQRALSNSASQTFGEAPPSHPPGVASSCPIQNRLANPGFEDGTGVPDVWLPSPPTIPGVITYTWDATTAVSGTRSVAVEVGNTSAARWQQVITVTPGAVYRFAGYVQVQDVLGECRLQVAFRDSGGAILEAVDLPGHSANIPWQYDFPHEVSVQAPDGAALADVNLFLRGPGKAWFDELIFGPAPSGSIAGTVTSGGTPLSGTLVSLWGTDWQAQTDAAGRYAIGGVPDASPRYLLYATHEGYQDRAQGDIDVVACQTTTVDLPMAAGANLVDNELRVKFASLALANDGPPPMIPTDAVISPTLYPTSVLPYLLPDTTVDSDSPQVQAAAEEIMLGLPPAERTNAYTVSHAVYNWIVQNIEYDVIYLMDDYADVTSGSWLTIVGEGWCWGHNFTDWLYKPSEMLQQRRGICVEHSRLATALLRAVGIPARPVQPYGAQFWLQPPAAPGQWIYMSTDGGRRAYRDSGDLEVCYGRKGPGDIRVFPVDEGPIVHSDWHTVRKGMWRETHPWEEDYPGDAAGYSQALIDLESFAQTGEAPEGPGAPPGSTHMHVIAYADFTLNFANIGDQLTIPARFPTVMESDYVTFTGVLTYWTNHPEWVVGTWMEEEVNPPVEGLERWFHIDFNRCQPVEGVEVVGPTGLGVGQTSTYTAAVTPLTATIPLTLTWDSGMVGSTAAYSWVASGIYTPVVTATNPCGEVTGSLGVVVSHRVYLPMIARSP